MNRFALAILAFSSTMLLANPGRAAFILKLDDLGTGGVDVTITDNMTGDQNPIAGIISFTGTVGSYDVNPTTLGLSLLDQRIDLHLDIMSTEEGSFQVMLTSTDFVLANTTPPWVLTSRIGGITDGTVEFQESYDPDNTEFGEPPGSTNGPTAPLGPGAFSTELTLDVTPSNPFSLSENIVITNTGPDQSTIFDASSQISAIPEPVSVTVWGSLLGLWIWRTASRRQRRDSA